MAEPTPPALAFGAGALVGPPLAPAGRVGGSGMSGALLLPGRCELRQVVVVHLGLTVLLGS